MVRTKRSRDDAWLDDYDVNGNNDDHDRAPPPLREPSRGMWTAVVGAAKSAATIAVSFLDTVFEWVPGLSTSRPAPRRRRPSARARRHHPAGAAIGPQEAVWATPLPRRAAKRTRRDDVTPRPPPPMPRTDDEDDSVDAAFLTPKQAFTLERKRVIEDTPRPPFIGATRVRDDTPRPSPAWQVPREEVPPPLPPATPVARSRKTQRPGFGAVPAVRVVKRSGVADGAATHEDVTPRPPRYPESTKNEATPPPPPRQALSARDKKTPVRPKSILEQPVAPSPLRGWDTPEPPQSWDSFSSSTSRTSTPLSDSGRCSPVLSITSNSSRTSAAIMSRAPSNVFSKPRLCAKNCVDRFREIVAPLPRTVQDLETDRASRASAPTHSSTRALDGTSRSAKSVSGVPWASTTTHPPLPTAEEVTWLSNMVTSMHTLLRPAAPTALSLDDNAVYERLMRRDREWDERINDLMRRDTSRVPVPLTEAMEADVDRALAHPKDAIVVTLFGGTTLVGADFATLRDRAWLNDEIINAYGKLIMARAQSNTALPKLHFFNSFFYPKIRDYGHKQVARWTKKFDLFAVDLVLFPVHLGNHWCLGCVNFRRKRIEYYDSLHGSTGPYFATVRKYLDTEYRAKKGGAAFDFAGWDEYYPLAPGDGQVPRQLNYYDCGVFTCAFMDHVARQEEQWGFTQTSMGYWRRRITYELVTGKMLE
ncbi:SUMO1 sentrin specific peptidase 1 [Allomyces arbusculus]|nr:SUMO1 sentrin specific peptidase 1 [Allomyces arbusculus]